MRILNRGNSNIYEFDENDRYFTTSCDPYIGYTLILFYTFHHKRTQRMALKKITEVIIKLEKIFTD
jgi:hypothetical protein